jgi:hypothetical protein
LTMAKRRLLIWSSSTRKTTCFTYPSKRVGIPDGVNNKMGTLFAPYDFFYGWRKISGEETAEKNGIDSLHTLLQGLFDKRRLCEVS